MALTERHQKSTVSRARLQEGWACIGLGEENGGVRRWLLRGGEGRVCALTEVAWRKVPGSERELPAEGTPAEGVCSFFFKFYFWWTIFKRFIEFVAISFCFLLWSFGHEACGILVP